MLFSILNMSINSAEKERAMVLGKESAYLLLLSWDINWTRAHGKGGTVGRGCSRLRPTTVRLPLAVKFLVGSAHDCAVASECARELCSQVFGRRRQFGKGNVQRRLSLTEDSIWRVREWWI